MKKWDILLFITALGLAAGYWWYQQQDQQSTDNAYLRADIIAISSRISGQVKQLAVTDNQWVEAGTLLIQLDDQDHQVALAQAQAHLQTQRAALIHLDQRLRAQQRQIDAAAAKLNASQSELARSEQQLQRLAKLAGQKFASRDDQDAAELSHRGALAHVAEANAQLAVEQAQLQVLEAERPRLQAQVSVADALLQQAQLQLSYSQIRAPRSGWMSSRQVQLGQNVSPTTRLLSLVTAPLWVEANFKETQISRMQEGQTVEVRVDALVGQPLQGYISSLAGATGSEFALLPPQNATGNFTKVVQRLPIRINLVPHPALAQLRAGMSVTATIKLNQP